jgi:hypothetical protein
VVTLSDQEIQAEMDRILGHHVPQLFMCQGCGELFEKTGLCDTCRSGAV